MGAGALARPAKARMAQARDDAHVPPANERLRQRGRRDHVQANVQVNVHVDVHVNVQESPRSPRPGPFSIAVSTPSRGPHRPTLP